MEHRLTKERAADGHTVETADQFVTLPGLDAVRETHAVKRGVSLLDLLGNPRPLFALGACIENAVERAIDGDLEDVPSYGRAQRPRDIETVERNDGSGIRCEPEQLAVFVGHGKCPGRVRRQQDFGDEVRMHS